MNFTTIILANGKFPKHPIPSGILKHAKEIVCCDGAANKLTKKGFRPHVIIGDLDSVNPEILQSYQGIIIEDKNTEINDLTKAVSWCKQNNKKNVAILGASGKRDDHFLGNVFLLSYYVQLLDNVLMYTEEGVFTPILQTTRFKSYKGQWVSVFSCTKDTPITSHNLKYSLCNLILPELWQGTLNEATSQHFSIKFEKGIVIVFQGY